MLRLTRSIPFARAVLHSSRSFASAATSASFVQRAPPTNVTKLKNGLRVASEDNFGNTATIALCIATGSVYENEKNNGVAHFLEHMAFKGTKNRTREGLEVEIENMGGQLNAYTSREHTVYYAKVFKQDVPKAVDILADIVQNANLDQAAIEEERGVILREQQEVGKVTEEVLFDHLHAVAFQGTPLGYTILGPAENIRSIKREHLAEYIKTHYTADRMVVVGAGAVKHEELVRLAEAAFSSLPEKSGVDLHSLPPVRYTGSSVTIEDVSLDKVHVALAVEGTSWSSPDQLTMMVIQNIVGGWNKFLGSGTNTSSRLCELIAKEGLADSFTSFNTCYNDTGLFGANMVTSPDHVDDLCCEVLTEWVRLRVQVTDSEVERAKNRLKAQLLMNLDGTTPVAEEIGRHFLAYGRRVSPAELFMRVDAIKTTDVQRVATEYLFDVCPTAVAIGDLHDFPEYNQLRGWLYWNRL